MPLVALGAGLGWAGAEPDTWQQGELRAAGLRLDPSEGHFKCIALDENWASQVALVAKKPPANAGDIRDAGLIPGQGRFPGGGHSNPFQYSSLENPHGQRKLAGYSTWGHKELGMTELLST